MIFFYFFSFFHFAGLPFFHPVSRFSLSGFYRGFIGVLSRFCCALKLRFSLQFNGFQNGITLDDLSMSVRGWFDIDSMLLRNFSK